MNFGFGDWIGQVTTGHGAMILGPTLLAVASGQMTWPQATPLLIAGAIGLAWPENTALKVASQNVATDIEGLVQAYRTGLDHAGAVIAAQPPAHRVDVSYATAQPAEAAAGAEAASAGAGGSVARALGAVLLLAIGLGLSACGTPAPISANPVTTALNDVNAAIPAAVAPQQALQNSLVNAEWNLDQAIAVGALSSTDPADGCLHATLTQLGIEPAAAGATAVPVKSFVPRVTNLVDGGSVLYIQAQQAKQLASGSVSIPPACQAVVGMFVIDAAKAGLNLGPAAIGAATKIGLLAPVK